MAEKELSQREKTFAIEYVSNGHNMTKAAQAAGYAHPDRLGTRLYARPHVKAEITKKLNKLNALAEFKGMLTFDDKRRKLQHVIEQCIDEKGNIDIRSAELALRAIALDNEMTGDKAAEKRANLNVTITDPDVAEGLTVMKQLIPKFERGY